MTPEYYADQYRRYATYVRNFGGNQIFKIACGPNGDDYSWTEVLMRKAGRQMAGLALHYYCGTGDRSRSATQFDEDDWFALLEEGAADGGAGHQALRDHGPVRSREAGRPDRRRVGRLARRSSRARTRASSISRTPCATPWWPASRSKSSTSTATACGWRTSPRRSTCCRR